MILEEPRGNSEENHESQNKKQRSCRNILKNPEEAKIILNKRQRTLRISRTSKNPPQKMAKESLNLLVKKKSYKALKP